MNLAAALEAARVTASAREEQTVTAPGQRWVPVTVQEFEEILAPLGFSQDAEASLQTGQVVFSRSSRTDATVFIRVYTSIPRHGSTVRGVGEDSIKVAIVKASPDGLRFKPLVKKLPYACRTRGWRTVLLKKLEEQMRRFGQPCRECGAATLERETRDGSRTFHGCVRFPECKGVAR